MKKKKGFTLIELLAIIVILAIIAVITVPIILNVIENSKKGATIDSAYGYKGAVQKYYLSKTVTNPNQELPTGTYNIADLPSDFKVSGESPSDGWVQLEKGQVVAYSLKFDEYTVTKTTDSEPVAEKGGSIAANSGSSNENIEVIKAGDTLATGDTVKLKWGSNTEEFIVILNDPKAPAGTTMLLAVNNINTSTGYQGLSASHYTVAFSGDNYWMDTTTTPNTLKTNYSNNNIYSYDSTNLKFVDTNNTRVYPDIYDSTITASSGTNYSVAYYVDMYVNNLKDKGFTGVNSGRILTYAEVDTGGLAEYYRTSYEKYWLGSADFSTYVRAVYSSGAINMNSDYAYTDAYGVRPVIYISTSDIQ